MHPTVVLLEPIAGKLAVGLFVVGICAAGVSSQFPNVLLLPWLICDYTGSERDMRRPRYRVIVLVMSLLGLVVPIFHARPVFVMIASQVANALLLPVTVVCIACVTARSSIMGEHKNRLVDNVILAGIAVFAFVMCGIGIKGLVDSFVG
jgi:manganese transport protein